MLHMTNGDFSHITLLYRRSCGVTWMNPAYLLRITKDPWTHGVVGGENAECGTPPRTRMRAGESLAGAIYTE